MDADLIKQVILDKGKKSFKLGFPTFHAIIIQNKKISLKEIIVNKISISKDTLYFYDLANKYKIQSLDDHDADLLFQWININL